ISLKGYNPNLTALSRNNIFGLPFTTDEANIVIIPVPWEASVSNFEGTGNGPGKVLESSYQIDLYDPFAPEAWKKGYAMESIDPTLASQNFQTRILARRYIKFLEAGGEPSDEGKTHDDCKAVNEACENLCIELEQKSLMYLEKGKTLVVLGGDHSVSLGLIRALARKHDGFGILQIDAHADLRKDYQGFTHSHASIMYNAINTPGVINLVQVGIRELCPEETGFIQDHPEKITTFFDYSLKSRLFEGALWKTICEEIVEKLPDEVYLTFDVDGLDPSLCPGAGTPLPGGLSYDQATYLLETLIRNGKKIIGADLVETGPGNIDGIVSSRLLFRIAGLLAVCNH
ncbi:MAG TPA: agmatinase family protein, partial [Bacteroidales bacterium]|nr:agmatinase family protein [Bacteroidales bacterium]